MSLFLEEPSLAPARMIRGGVGAMGHLTESEPDSASDLGSELETPPAMPRCKKADFMHLARAMSLLDAETTDMAEDDQDSQASSCQGSLDEPDADAAGQVQGIENDSTTPGSYCTSKSLPFDDEASEAAAVRVGGKRSSHSSIPPIQQAPACLVTNDHGPVL